MRKENEMKSFDDDETDEMYIEDLTEIQGGLEDDEAGIARKCGLGCFLGEGSGTM